ncbi:S24/S26 family peptidase, partial [Sinorhizobium meliloti]
MSQISPTSAVVRQKRPVLALLAVSYGIALVVIIGGFIGGLRINTTPSEPLGLWRVAPLEHPIQVGEMVFVCPPETDAVSKGFERGYLRSGLCSGGFGHWVTGGSHPPPVPTERSVRISRTTLFGSFTAPR